MKRITVFKWLLLLFAINAKAQQSVQKMVVETKYLLYLPDHYADDATKQWPLLIFLHGSGESGSDIEKVKFHGPPQLIEQGKKFPFIVVSPQSDVPNGWDIDNLYKLLQNIKKTYRVDEQRIYLTGLSMGGYGTWVLAMKHPEEFAAIAPVCGGGDTSNAWKLRNIPVWCFHGALDNVVPIAGSENMVKAASRYNPNVRFTVYPDKNHNSWDTTYNTSDTLYNWLLAQSKFKYKEAKVNPTIFKKYEGIYVGPDRDTVKIVASQNGLMAFPGKDTVSLKAAGENLFFLQADRPMDIRFTVDRNGIASFYFMGDRKLLYQKIRAKK